MAAELLTPAACSNNLHLPLEICREILTRLPVKSIVRFRSVRKSGYSLVSCPDFISDHSNLDKNPNRVLVQLDDWSDDVCSFSSHDKSFMESHEHDEIPESFLGQWTKIIGSCKGLICLQNFGSTDDSIILLIWNPTIRKIVELPSPTYTRLPPYLGFGFDPNTNDYKVLSCQYTGDSPDMVFQIFDLRKGVWRDISPQNPSLCYHLVYYADCYLDGIVHWNSGLGILLSFNFSDKCFRKIKLPDCAKLIWHEDDTFITSKSVSLGGLIYVIVFSKLYNGPTDMSRSCSVWAMKEYGIGESWTKVYDIDLRNAQMSLGAELSPYQFLLWENGEVLMVHEHPFDNTKDVKCRVDLVLYNTEGRKSKCVFPVTKRIKDVCLYEESLVLM